MLERLENLSALYANPHRFMNLAARLHAPLWLTAVGALAFGLFMVSGVPDDYQQGATVRIMFVHVPAAWMALFAYSFIFCQHCGGGTAPSIGLSGSPRGAPVGAVFTLVALVTGALWGQPMWGTWWVWDARLTSVLVLLFIYLGYIALWEAIDDYGRGARHINFGSCRFCQCADCKIFRRLVERIAPTGQRVAFCAARPACRFSLSAFGHGRGVLLLFLAITLTRLQMEVLRQRLTCAPERGLREVGTRTGPCMIFISMQAMASRLSCSASSSR